MKKLPLKWKLTILYAVFMILMTALMLGILFSLSSSEILSSVEQDLESRFLRPSMILNGMAAGWRLTRTFTTWKMESIFPPMMRRKI